MTFKSSTSPWRINRNSTVLGLVLVISAAIRFHGIDRFGTGYDEIFTVHEANGLHPGLITESTPFTLADLRQHDDWRGAANACVETDGGNGILYILAMHAWTEVLGNGNLPIRLFSLLCGLAVILLTHRLAQELTSNDTQALLAAAFAGLAPLLVDYSQEARSYMLATALALQSTRQFVRLARSTHPALLSAASYGLVSGLALLCHYYAAYVVAAHAAYALFRLRPAQFARWSLLAAVVAVGTVGIWLWAGGWHGITNMTAHQGIYAAVIRANPSYDVYYRAATLKHLLQDLTVQCLWLGGSGLTLLGPSLRVMASLLLIPVGLLIGFRWSRITAEGSSALLVCLCVAGPAYCLLTSVAAGHTFGMRYYYVTLGAPYVAILLARGAWGWLSHARIALRLLGVSLISMLILMMGISIASFRIHGYRGNNKPEQIAPVARIINALTEAAPHAELLLIHRSARDAATFNLHLGESASEVPQIIEPLSLYRHTVVASAGDAEPRIVLRLR
jgi:hypothetical protein